MKVLDDLADRGVADAFAQRPRASEHPVYNDAYSVAAVKRRVRDCEAIIAAQEGEGCPDCGHDTPGTLAVVGCACKGGPARVVRGFYVLFGADTDTDPCVFRSDSWLRGLMADGTPMLNVIGEDISHRANPLQ